MEFISGFVREQKRYTKRDLNQIFHFAHDNADGFIRKLKTFGILKVVKNNKEQLQLTDLIDEDIELVDLETEDDNYLYVFTYVGIVTVGKRVIKCYPKYLLDALEPLEEMKQILKVIKKYGAKEQNINLFNGNSVYSSFNLLGITLFLLNDYNEYGIYINNEDILEENGTGEIHWDKSINEAFTLISNNKPYYTELFTKRTVDNEYDYFKRLHECILTKCSNLLKESDLLELFEFEHLHLSDEFIKDFGDKEYILYRLQEELNAQFNTRKQTLLKTIYTYIEQGSVSEDNYGISMYGTNSFNLVWEDVCSNVFDNKLQTQIGKLDLPISLLEGYTSTDRLIDIIKKPIWLGINSDNESFEKTSNETLIPDLITLSSHEGVFRFVILDAKYYNIQLEEEKQLRGQPGVGDLTKQYLYQLAYKSFLNDHQIYEVKNCFLMPSNSESMIEKGTAKLDMLSSLGLQDIKIRLLPAKAMYTSYLSNKRVNVSYLNL